MAIKPPIYSDLKYGFDKKINGDFSQVTDESSINQSLLTLLYTKSGERFFNPEYGTGLYKYIYEPFDETTANSIIQEIDSAIKFYEGNRIVVTDVNIELDYDSLVYNISVLYKIKSTSLTGILNLKLIKT